MTAPPTPRRRKAKPNVLSNLVNSDFDLLAFLFDPKRPIAVPRTVYINLPVEPLVPTGDKQVDKRALNGRIYESNQVLTSKYNIATFIPRNLLEQFRRVANVFFLGTFSLLA